MHRQQQHRGGDRHSEDRWRQANDLAVRFHRYVHESGATSRNQQASSMDRTAAGALFCDFCETPSQRRLETLVMTRMRQRRLIKTSKRDGHVWVTFSNLDGTFPSLQERASARKVALAEKEREQQNKHGVVVSNVPDELVKEPIIIGEPGSSSSSSSSQTVTFQVTNVQDAGSTPIKLVKVALDGPHRTSFKLQPVERSIICPGGELAFELSIAPKRIGVFRCVVTCHFLAPSNDDEHFTFTISRFVTLRSTFDKDIDMALQPTSPYKRAKRKVYGTKPVETFDPPKSRGGENPYKKLSQYSIPHTIEHLILCEEFQNALEDIKWPPPSSDRDRDRTEGYSEFWKNMLWAQEFQNHLDIQVFDMDSVSLDAHGRCLKLEVPGLAEGRPSVLRGDLVHVSWKKKLYKGRVREVQNLHVIMEFHSSFHQRYHPNIDRVNVRFTFSRMTIRTSHAGCLMAETKLGQSMLAPTLEDANAIRSDSQPRAMRRPTNWINRYLNQEQKTAVENIVAGAMRPLPYVIFGPP